MLHVSRVRTDGQKNEEHIFGVWHMMCVT
jgi:hypothetical protein